LRPRMDFIELRSKGRISQERRKGEEMYRPAGPETKAASALRLPSQQNARMVDAVACRGSEYDLARQDTKLS